MQVYSHYMQDLHLVQVCFRLVQVFTRYFFFIGGRFVSASLSSLVRRVFRSSTPSGALINRCRFSVLSLWGDPYTPMTQ